MTAAAIRVATNSTPVLVFECFKGALQDVSQGYFFYRLGGLGQVFDLIQSGQGRKLIHRNIKPETIHAKGRD